MKSFGVGVFRLFLVSCLVAVASLAHALETTVIVRVKAKDAKFIGSSLGGAYVIIRDKTNGTILAEGKTAGSTGNTARIMAEKKERYAPLSDSLTGKFTATLDLQEPLFVRVEVMAPYNYKGARVHAATELWLIPGRHLLGDGVVVEIPGFIIDILSPRTHNYIPLASVQNGSLNVQANMVMMCGCVIDKGGTWNADEMEVKALVKKDGEKRAEIPMRLTAVNLFEGAVPVLAKGDYEIIVYAYHPQSGNTGVDKVNFVVF